MKILCISQYFPPEVAAGGIRTHELGKHWVEAGHEVSVITGFPSYPSGIIPPEYRTRRRYLRHTETVDGIRVIRTWASARPNGGSLDRLCNYGSFCGSATISGTITQRPDVVIATSPPLPVGISGSAISRSKRVPWILELRDLWPESLAAVNGAGTSLAMRGLARLARALYCRCDHIVAVSPAFCDRLAVDWNVPRERISVVENGVEAETFSPGLPDAQLKRELGLEGKFVVSYIGTIGLAHGLATILTAAELLKPTAPDIRFLVIGGGAEADALASEARCRGLNNVLFTGVQPRERIPALLRASDLCMVLLKKADVFKTVIPTKMLEAMACSRPVILGVDGQARQILEAAQAGVYIEPEDATALTQAIVNLKNSPELCRNLGAHGKRHIDRHFSRREMAGRYLGLLEEITGRLRVGSSRHMSYAAGQKAA